MKLFNVLGCIVLLVISGCGGNGGEGTKLGSVFPEIDSVSTPAVSVPGRSGKISGFVYDYNDSGKVMGGVTVSLNTEAGSLLASQSTDSSGYYIFTGFPSGTYKVSFAKTGYADVWYSGAAGEVMATLVTVTSPETTTGINGFMGNGGKISGTVTDYDLAAAKGGVSVNLYSGADLLASQPTDSSGKYTFIGFATGTYKVSFSMAGYADVWYSNATTASAATNVAVTAPDTASGINGVMGGGGKITGTVTDASGASMDGVSVSLYSGGVLLTSLSTGASGNYTFIGFPSGTYKVSFSKAGYAGVWYGGASTEAAASDVTVDSTATKSGINGVIGVGGKITGTVTDYLAATVSGVSVNLYSGGELLTSLSTGASGDYTFIGFAPGAYKVSFSKTGYADVWYNGAATEAAATAVSVVGTATTTGINGVMGVGGKITGRVTDASGAPMSGVGISLNTNTGTFLVSQSTDSNGYYTFTGFPSGTYKVLFSKTGYADVWYSGAAAEADAALVTVTPPNTTAGINVVML